MMREAWPGPKVLTIAQLYGFGTRGARRGRGGIGHNGGILHGPEERQLSAETVDLLEVGLVADILAAWRIWGTHHSLLFLFQLEMKVRGGQRARMPYRSRTRADACVVACQTAERDEMRRW